MSGGLVSTPKDYEILVRAGGAELTRIGTPWRRRRFDAREVEAPVYTRADASICATYANRGLVLRTAAANKLRPDWSSGECGLLFDGAADRTNAFTRSEELDNAAYTKTHCSISANGVSAPDEAATGDKIVEDGTNNQHKVERATPTLTDNTRSTFSVHVAANTRSWVYIETTDKSNTFRRSWVNLATGTKGTIASGHDIVVKPQLSNTFYRIECSFDAASGATPPAVAVGLATADAVHTYAGDGASGLWCWGWQFETDKAFASTYIKTVAAAITRKLESCTLPIGFGPQSLTAYVRVPRPSHADATGTLADVAGMLSIDAATAGFSLFFGSASRVITAQFNSGTTVAASQNVPAGSVLEICAQFASLDSAGTCKLDVGAGFGAASTAASTALSAWGSNNLRLGAMQGGTDRGLYGIINRLLICRGLFTLAECQAVTW
jgi:hypothetical protein